MGVACPRLSDEPGYTMVEPSGGSCACREEDSHQGEQQQLSSGCCSPHVFTSVLLGVLSCVLMTGGVFLAFHRWDPMWLTVSGVGVVLILIGTVLHCCHHHPQQRPKRRSCKGCPPLPPADPHHHHHHVMPNGSLTEQLLPLSNARSVSQLSLNMLPGYFPPVVAAYGIEQHSAVVQNISRLVQQQQQSTTGSCSPGVASPAGKSFIVLSLPADATSANLQNLVATVYQLDGSAVESSASEAGPAEGAAAKPAVSLVHAEVQTCSLWPTAPAAPPGATTRGEISPDSLDPSPSGSTQTDDTLDLMDCRSPDVAPICDNHSCDNDDTAVLVDIPLTPPPPCAQADPPEDGGAAPPGDVLVEVPESNPQSSASSSGSLSTEVEEEEGELMDRSSPPPSYEELEGGGGGGAFGLAYGTI